MCKHDIKGLIGGDFGVKCKTCGAVFPTWVDLIADRAAQEPKAETPPKKAIKRKKGAE